jgi:predicted XRE-type DNA-binding protein
MNSTYKTKAQLSREVKLLMQEQSISQKELAAACNISQGHLSKLLDGKDVKVKSISKGLVMICRHLGVALQPDLNYDPIKDRKIIAALRSTVAGNPAVIPTLVRVIRALGQEPVQ